MVMTYNGQFSISNHKYIALLIRKYLYGGDI
nr:MAG TPA: hypothetical protein [Caudoviricetes sp.]